MTDQIRAPWTPEQVAALRGPIGWARHHAALRDATPPQDAPRAPQDAPEHPDAGAETPDGTGGAQAGADGGKEQRDQLAAALTEVLACLYMLNRVGGSVIGYQTVNVIRPATYDRWQAVLQQATLNPQEQQ
ncbi:hypothetical protein ACFWD7_06180 [Streptomyces mirabilis]|uniref:hypothetical protein n=1 Tax=Streptomyces mirabilis TaxID=68239 RepID=UPI003677910A